MARAASAGSGLDIWVADESDGTAQLAIPAVDFRPLELVGYAVRDRLRLDRPTAHGEGSLAEFVRLPQGGRVFRVAGSGSTGLLVVVVRRGWRIESALYDLASDPAERSPVSLAGPDVDRLSALLDELVASLAQRRAWRTEDRAPVDPQAVEALRALGYVR